MDKTIARWITTTEAGNKIYNKVYYTLGGYNHFTSKSTPRGYYLSMQRSKNKFKAFKGLEDEAGAIRVLIKEVKRRSNKAADEAIEAADSKVMDIIKEYNL